jgi:hypothetical protein
MLVLFEALVIVLTASNYQISMCIWFRPTKEQEPRTICSNGSVNK